MSDNALKIGVAGLGTVGCGAIKILQDHAELLEKRCGRPLQIVGVNARNKAVKRAVDVSAYPWFDHAQDMIPEVDVLLEMVGESEGFAYNLVKQALDSGVHVVTANKALLAHYGVELAELAESKGVSLMYEAAVAGGIPAIKVARESFAGNQINAVYGILNGTSNYIMSVMRETGRTFDDVLQEAQDKGYAEADPAFDIDGVDAGHKVALLAAICFGVKPNFSAVRMQGIGHLTKDDVFLAGELGYKIKLLGSAKCFNGRILQAVEPCLVPKDSPFAAIENVYNAVYFDCDAAQTPLLTGLGAGAGPTGSSVVADVVDIARGMNAPTFGVPVDKLAKHNIIDPIEVEGRYFMRFTTFDKTGVVADLSAILRDHDVSD